MRVDYLRQLSPLEWVIRPDRVSHWGVAASDGSRRRRRRCRYGEWRSKGPSSQFLTGCSPAPQARKGSVTVKLVYFKVNNGSRMDLTHDYKTKYLIGNNKYLYSWNNETKKSK